MAAPHHPPPFHVHAIGQPCRCADAAPGRRRSLGLFAALLMAPLAPAVAADDLLDPSVLQRKGGSTTPLPEGPGAGRAMAESVTLSLDGLTAAAAARVSEIGRLDTLIAETQAKLSRARELMDVTMADYRQGLFCSGCGKTKTEILKVGDTFPHPGQKIVRPTQQQIDAKEREMQAPIDRFGRELQDLQARRRKTAAERDEAVAQIDAGLALWNTGLAFERRAIELQRLQAERSYNADRLALDNAANRLTGNTPAVQQEREQLRTARVALEKRRRARRDEIEATQAQANTSAREQQERIDGYLGRNPLQKVLSASATIAAVVPTSASFNDLGGLYRLGDFSVANHDETLPRVENFIAGYRKLPPLPAAPRPPSDTAAPQKLRELLKDLLACEPDDAACNKPPTQGGSGVRG